MTQRLTPEREQVIRGWFGANMVPSERMANELLAEITALRAELAGAEERGAAKRHYQAVADVFGIGDVPAGWREDEDSSLCVGTVAGMLAEHEYRGTRRARELERACAPTEHEEEARDHVRPDRLGASDWTARQLAAFFDRVQEARRKMRGDHVRTGTAAADGGESQP